MNLVPFSKKYPDHFLEQSEDNFDVFLEKLNAFYRVTRSDICEGQASRRTLNGRFAYSDELQDATINQKGISSEQLLHEFNDMLKGSIRHQNPNTAFNIIPPPLLDSVAALTLTNLYTPNATWDFISGKLCLYEKRILRMLGSLVRWPHADGFVVTGGKQALTYAIKNGMGRATATKRIPMEKLVVLCSALAHYSIEHVCHFLGLSPENCIRVSALPCGEIDPHALENTIRDTLTQGKSIATVIAVAGGTIDLIPDPITTIKGLLLRISNEYDLDYVPYLHVDSVITWAWLSFENNPAYTAYTEPNVAKKIEHVTNKLRGIHDADSFAADFHKIGFCPYASGVFIVKDPAYLRAMTSEGYLPKETAAFGEIEPFRQTFENSRSSHAIVSIWTALRKMGLEGIREFIIYQLTVSEHFKKKIQQNYSQHFELLNDFTNGWEIVFKPHFRFPLTWEQLQDSSLAIQTTYINDCHAFLNDLWFEPLNKNERVYPTIGFVRKYCRKGYSSQGFPAFLIHPTSPHYDDNAIDVLLEAIVATKIAYDKKSTTSDASSQQDYLCDVIPPR